LLLYALGSMGTTVPNEMQRVIKSSACGSSAGASWPLLATAQPGWAQRARSASR
jgi:hypothetical protein